MILNRPLLLPRLRVVRDNPNMDDHVVLKVLISRNQCVPTVVLEADAVCSTFVKTVKVLDGSHDRVGGIMGKDLYPHWQSCSMIGGTVKQ